MNHLFISYSRTEETIIDSFVNKLRAEQISIWQDKSGAGTGIPFSERWLDVIEEAIYMSSGAIFFASENWENSDACRHEMDIVKNCGVPFIVLNPEEIDKDPERYIDEVKQFIEGMVENPYNDCRTELCSAAYEYSKGMNPYQLVRHTRGVGESVLFILKVINEYKEVIETEGYRENNPKYYEYMNRFLRKARNIKLKSMAWVSLGVLVAILAVILTASIILAIPKGVTVSEQTYSGLAISGSLEKFKTEDPIIAAQKVLEFDEEQITGTSFASLDMDVMEIMNKELPERVILDSTEGNEKKRIMEQKNCQDSEHYLADPDLNKGSIRITDLHSFNQWTIDTPGAVSSYSWNENGTKLIYSAGSKVFIYDPSGSGNPIQLNECFEQVREVKFFKQDVKEDVIEKVVAVTERDTVLIWDDPIPDKEFQRKGIRYGVFTDDSIPTAIYIDGDTIVVNKNQKETTYQPFLDWTLTNTGFAVSEDGRNIAVILSKDEEYEVGVVDLTDGSVICEIKTPYRPTALCYDSDNKIYASSFGCGIMRIDPNKKEVIAGTEQLYFSNIIKWKDRLVLTDGYGWCTLFDKDLKKVKEYGNLNDICVSYLDLAIAENKGYLYSVNRGAGDIFGCSRFNLDTQEIHRFVIKNMNRVAANTAVAISEDENYVVFGYPNGVIRVYEVEHMYLACEKTVTDESISAIRISPDNSVINVLGESGNIYSVLFRHYDENVSLEVMKNNWVQMQEDLKNKVDTYYMSVEN